MTPPLIPFQQLCKALGNMPANSLDDTRMLELRASIESATQQALDLCRLTRVDPRDLCQTGSVALLENLPDGPTTSTKLNGTAWEAILRHGPDYTAHVLRKGISLSIGLPKIVANIAEMPAWRTALSDPSLQASLMPALLDARSDRWPSNHPEIWADLLEATVAAEPEAAEDLLGKQLRMGNIPETTGLLLLGVPMQKYDLLLSERLSGYFCKKYTSPHARLVLHQTFPSVADVVRKDGPMKQFVEELRAEARAARGSY